MTREDHSNILLSIVVCGRNDNYFGDFKYRLSTAINFLSRNASAIGRLDQLELILVDWNSEIPLHRELELIHDARQILWEVRVPPDMARRHSPGHTVFRIEMAVNVGVRRARGEFILAIPADVLISQAGLLSLTQLLEGKLSPVFDIENTLMNIERKLIPWQVVERKMSLDQWERYLQVSTRFLGFCNHFIGLCAGYGGILMHRNLWHESQAFKEDRAGWGADDIDIGLRMNQKYPSVDLTHFGIFFYDMYQPPHARMERKKNAKLPKVSTRMDAGNPHWGLAREPLERVPWTSHGKARSTASSPSTFHGASSLGGVKGSLLACFIRHPICFAGMGSPGAWWALILLSWCTQNHHPARLLEYGNINGTWVFPILSHQFPCMEITTIGKKMPHDDLLMFKPTTYDPLLENFQGTAHFMYSHVAGALDRLKKMDTPSFDLILFKSWIFDSMVDTHFDQALACLGDMGCLVVQGRDFLEFQRLWTHVEASHSDCIKRAWPRACVGVVANSSQLFRGGRIGEWEPSLGFLTLLGWGSRAAGYLRMWRSKWEAKWNGF